MCRLLSCSLHQISEFVLQSEKKKKIQNISRYYFLPVIPGKRQTSFTVQPSPGWESWVTCPFIRLAKMSKSDNMSGVCRNYMQTLLGWLQKGVTCLECSMAKSINALITSFDPEIPLLGTYLQILWAYKCKSRPGSVVMKLRVIDCSDKRLETSCMLTTMGLVKYIINIHTLE